MANRRRQCWLGSSLEELTLSSLELGASIESACDCSPGVLSQLLKRSSEPVRRPGGAAPYEFYDRTLETTY
jgi:hypothetical protein